MNVDARLDMNSQTAEKLDAGATLDTFYISYQGQLVLKNASTIAQNCQFEVQLGFPSSSSLEIEADKTFFPHAPFTNKSDWTLTFQASDIFLFQLGATPETILGESPVNTETAFTSVTVDSVVKQMIFSANSGLLLWDYDGFNIGVTL